MTTYLLPISQHSALNTFFYDSHQRQPVVFRDPQDDEYGTRFTLTDGVIAPVAFPEVQVAIAQIISA